MIKSTLFFLPTYFDQHLTFYLAGSIKFIKYLLHRVIYVKNTPSPNYHSETLLVRMSVHVTILPLIQPCKKLKGTISFSARIYKQSLLNSLKKETRYADAQTLKKKSEFKNRKVLPYRSKTIQKIF